MKNHLKRMAAPKAWMLNRKENKYTIRPKAGAHPLNQGLSLGAILRDELKLASTLVETRKLLVNNEVLIDGKRRKEYRFIVGLFDVLKIPAQKLAYRFGIDEKGRPNMYPISAVESEMKICKVTGKTALDKNRIQLNLHDGKNIISTEKVRVGDSIVISLPSLELKEVLPLKPGAVVFLTKGKHMSDIGIFKEFKGEEAVYTKDKEEVNTSKKYLFVVGKDKKPVMEINIKRALKN